MKQLPGSQPMCYMLSNSTLITALPYIDQQLPEYRTRIQYLIKNQQQNMEFSQEKYLNALPMPQLKIVGSEEFEHAVGRIRERMEKEKQAKEAKEVKDKKGDGAFQKACGIVNLSKITVQQMKNLEKAQSHYENNLLKQVNLQIAQKLGPIIQKQSIAALDKIKQNLLAQIQKQKKEIQNINKNRQYAQLQAKQRERTVRDRLKVMIYKHKKLANQ